MSRLSNTAMKERYAAIANIIKDYKGEVVGDTGKYNVDRIREILNDDYAMSISERHLRIMLKEGKGDIKKQRKSSAKVNLKSLVVDFKNAIDMVKDIMHDPDADAKLKMAAMQTMRYLENDLVKLVENINAAELEKASLNRPILHLKFGRPMETSLENLAKKKLFTEKRE